MMMKNFLVTFFYLGRSIICIYAYTTIFFLLKLVIDDVILRDFQQFFPPLRSSINRSLSLSMYVKLMSVMAKKIERVEAGNLKGNRNKKLVHFIAGFCGANYYYLSKIHHVIYRNRFCNLR